MIMKWTTLSFVLALGLLTGRCADDKKPVEPASAEKPATPAAQEPTPPSASVSGETVYFGYDDYTLTSEAQGKLNTLAAALKAAAGSVVQIEGHCDERGSIEYNLALGERRAQSVKNYLVQLGVDPARLSTISYGEEKPSTQGHNEAAWSKNRRAEFVVTKN